jgi:hypothetical protein
MLTSHKQASISAVEFLRLGQRVVYHSAGAITDRASDLFRGRMARDAVGSISAAILRSWRGPARVAAKECRQTPQGATGSQPSDLADDVSVRTLKIPAQDPRARSSPDETSG